MTFAPVRRRSVSRWLPAPRPVGFALALGSFVFGGCGKASLPDHAADSVAAADESSLNASDSVSQASENAPIVRGGHNLEHDAGLTLAGTRLSHSFTVTNTLAREVFVRDEKDDIIVNCGCTSFSLAKYNLAPGERTSVDVSLNTAHRNGAVKKGGEIAWTAADGTRYSTKFSIKCHVKSAFDLTPGVLSFGAEDVKRGTVKDVQLASSFPVDWSTITASSGSNAFRILECEASDDGAVCHVECVARGDVEAAQAALTFTARALSAGGGGAGSYRGNTAALSAGLGARSLSAVGECSSNQRWRGDGEDSATRRQVEVGADFNRHRGWL